MEIIFQQCCKDETGKRIDLRNRVYCLECSPFNQRKMCGPESKFYKKWEKPTTKIVGSRKRVLLKIDRICKICDKIFHQATRGNECSTCKARRIRKERKQKLVDLKGGKCSLCGYKKCLASLQFHHTDPSKKELQFSQNSTNSWETLLKELDKCILVCSNCHNEIHHPDQIISEL